MTTAAAMDALPTMRANIATVMQTAVTTAIATVEVHRGRFDVAAVERYAKKVPFIGIAYLGSAESQDVGDGLLDVAQWGAFIMTAEKPSDARDERALKLNGLVKSIVQRNRWGNDNAQMAKRVRADNLVTAKLDELGVDLHVVSWEQAVMIPPYDEPATLDDFNTLFTEYDLAESTDSDTEADDLIDLTG